MTATSVGGVVLHEAALAGGLAGGDDGVLRGAVGGGDDAGGEVLVGVEVGDGGHLGEAKAVAAVDGLGKHAEGGDAAVAAEERVLKCRDG